MMESLLNLYDAFDSIDELKLAIVTYQQSKNEVYYIKENELLGSTSNLVNPDKLLYSKVKFACVNGMTRNDVLKCQAYILAELNDSKTQLIIKDMNTLHNHTSQHNLIQKKKDAGISNNKAKKSNDKNMGMKKSYARMEPRPLYPVTETNQTADDVEFLSWPLPAVPVDEVAVDVIKMPNFDYDLANIKSPTPDKDLSDEVMILDDSSGTFKSIKRSAIRDESSGETMTVDCESEVMICLREKNASFRSSNFDYQDLPFSTFIITPRPNTSQPFSNKLILSNNTSGVQVFNSLSEIAGMTAKNAIDHLNTSNGLQQPAVNSRQFNPVKKLRPMAEVLGNIGLKLTTNNFFKDMLKKKKVPTATLR